MAKGDHSYKRKPKGSTAGGYARPRVQIGFDVSMMAQIARIAKQNKKSFAAQVRELVEDALYLALRVDQPRTRR